MVCNLSLQPYNLENFLKIAQSCTEFLGVAGPLYTTENDPARPSHLKYGVLVANISANVSGSENNQLSRKSNGITNRTIN